MILPIKRLIARFLLKRPGSDTYARKIVASVQMRLRRSILLFLLVAPLAEISMVNLAPAADEKVFIFWDTVSPNGKYALAWTKAGSVEPDLMPYPDDPKGGVKDWLLEVASRKPTVLLPEAAYWRLPNYRPNHYSLETVWSDDSSRLLVLLDSRYSTDQVLLVDPREESRARFCQIDAAWILPGPAA